MHSLPSALSSFVDTNTHFLHSMHSTKLIPLGSKVFPKPQMGIKFDCAQPWKYLGRIIRKNVFPFNSVCEC